MQIQIENIQKSFANRIILKDISLDVKSGETIAIIGPSGSGKTTFLNILGALDQPDSGKVIFNDTVLNDLNDKELAAFRNTGIGFVFQMHYLLPQCSILENVLIPTLALADKSKRIEARDRAFQLLKRVGLIDFINKRPSQLSGGECQRVAFVRALINQPQLVLCDEPTGSLDLDTSLILSDLLLELNKENNTSLIVVTHSMELAQKMNRVYKLKNGALEQIEK